MSTIRLKNYKKSLRSYTILMTAVLIATAIYTWLQYQKFMGMQQALAQEQAYSASLQTSANKISNQYKEQEKLFQENFSNILASIDEVYPHEQNYTKIIRTLEDFEQANNTPANPLLMSNFQLSQPRTDTKKDYMILPFTLNLTTTRDNFDKFLHFIENSGNLEDKSRLLDIRSISISFNAMQNSARPVSAVKLLNVSVALQAYFQKTPEPAKK